MVVVIGCSVRLICIFLIMFVLDEKLRFIWIVEVWYIMLRFREFILGI